MLYKTKCSTRILILMKFNQKLRENKHILYEQREGKKNVLNLEIIHICQRSVMNSRPRCWARCLRFCRTCLLHPPVSIHLHRLTAETLLAIWKPVVLLMDTFTTRTYIPFCHFQCPSFLRRPAFSSGAMPLPPEDPPGLLL